MPNMTIHQNKEEGREDSFWYEGEIASLGKCILIATGEIRVTFPDGTVCRDQQAPYEARSRGYTDKDLEKLECLNNNWFEVISKDGEDVLGDVRYTYDGGIELLKEYVNEKVYEETA